MQTYNMKEMVTVRDALFKDTKAMIRKAQFRDYDKKHGRKKVN
jgi:hypothetical protein